MLINWFDLHSGDPNPILPIAQSSEAEQLIAAYANSPSIDCCILDSHLRYLSINATLARINGIPADAHLGRSLREVVGEITDQIEPWVHRTFSEGEPILNVTISGRRPNQSESGQWIDHFHPIKDESGKVIRVGILVVEKTDEKKLRNAFDELGNELRGEAERLQMLHDVNALISSNWDLPQVFPRISARIRRLLRHEYASFSLHEPATGLLVRHAIDFPLSKGLSSNVQISAGDSPSGLVLQESKPRIFSRDELQRFEGETTDRFLAEGLESLCCVPLNRPSGTLGVLVLGSTRQKAFADKDASLLEIVAAQMAIAIENRRAIEELNALKKRLAEERNYLSGEIASQALFSEIIGQSPALKLVLEQVATVATSRATVLILGETGTGKGLIARAIHRMSRLQDGPFIKLNCAAIPTGLLESELFGHEKGAFTGAVSQKVGRMELADGGTLFLDEVGEIPLELQPKLLRVLQDQEFERLGSNRTIRVKVRVVAATNRDLVDDVAKHQFRSDLFYRLNVFPSSHPGLTGKTRGYPPPCALLRAKVLESNGTGCRIRAHRNDGYSHQLGLARQHPRTREPYGTVGDSQPGKDPPRSDCGTARSRTSRDLHQLHSHSRRC